MARRTTSVTKGRTTPKKAASAAPAPDAPTPKRRGKAKSKDDAALDMPALDATVPDVAAADTPPDATETTPPKPRRGRKSKPEMTASGDEGGVDATADATIEPDSAPPAEPELPAVDAEPERPAKAAPKRSSPRMARRNREPEVSAPPPIEMADEPDSDMPSAPETAETPQAPPAAHWNAETGTVTFDWAAIEQVAASEGVNQPMAKLLLAARAEGARSRWPF